MKRREINECLGGLGENRSQFRLVDQELSPPKS